MIGPRPFRPSEQGPAFDVGAHIPPPGSVEALAAWFGFSVEELALNRAGRLSERQRQTVFFQGVRIVVMGGVLIVLEIMLAAAVAPAIRSWLEQAAFAALLALTAVLVGVIGKAAAEIVAPRAHRAIGMLRPAGSARQPRLQAGNRLLVISYKRWRRLAAFGEQRYCTYYAGRTLLSVEPWNED